MVKFKAYTWNSNTGRDFTKVSPNYNLVQRASLKAIETIEFLPDAIYLSDGTNGKDNWKRKECPTGWNRKYSYGSVITKPEGVDAKTGITFCTDYDRGNYPSLYPNFVKPDLTQGTSYSYSADVYNPNLKPLKIVCKAVWGEHDEVIQTITIGSQEWGKISTAWSISETSTVDKFGICIETEDSSTNFMALEVYLPKIEAGVQVTPFRSDHDEHFTYIKVNEDDETPPFTGFYEGDVASDNFADYTWFGSRSYNDFFYMEERGTVKQDAVWCYTRPLGQRVLIGIDEDTFSNASGRTVKFHILNGNKSVFDMTGNWIYPEQFTDNRQMFDSDTGAWVDNQEVLYITNANTAIDTTFGEMANNIIEGFYYQQADKRYRVDEVLRSAMFNAPWSMGDYWKNEDMTREQDKMRASYGIADCRVSVKTNYGSMNDWTENVAFPTGVHLRPVKIDKFDTTTKMMKGISSASTIWAKQTLKAEPDTEDWFRSYSNDKTVAVPTQILFANYETKKAWHFTQQSNGTWKRSSEFTIPAGATALLNAWTAIVPKNGQLKGSIVFTDKNYADYGDNLRPQSLELDQLFPTISYEGVKFNPQYYSIAYNTKLFWWGQKANVANNSYGECGVRIVDFMTGLANIERVYK